MNHRRHGTSMIGILIAMACIVVMFALLMTSLNKAVTGEGSALEGTVRSVEDQLRLQGLYLALTTYAGQNRDMYPVPSEISGSRRVEEDTTANFYSALIAQRYVSPESLIAGNEYSSWVEVDSDYDYNAYNPRDGVYWDPRFQADLTDISNVSFAHMPFHGRRFDTYWQNTMKGDIPLIGNRGPKDGVINLSSLTMGRNGQWAGHILFSDGSIEFVNTFTPSRMSLVRDGQAVADNLFVMEDGAGGSDGMLGFTAGMTKDGPELQWD